MDFGFNEQLLIASVAFITLAVGSWLWEERQKRLASQKRPFRSDSFTGPRLLKVKD